MTVNNYTTHLGPPGPQPFSYSNTFEQKLDLWVETQPNRRDAETAKQKILECLENDSGFLALENLFITSLPEGFNPPKLKELYLVGTQITSLPEGFNPPQLQVLYLDETQITSLPEGFNPPQLKELFLEHTQITSLPEGFNPPQLKELFLEHTQITSLPEGFNPPQLQVLYLDETQITSLPEGFNPPCLELLDLSNTEMTSLPETLFNLPRSCKITLDLSRFSTNVRENLQERVTGENYEGPRFQFSMGSSAQVEGNDFFLEQVFQKVFEKSGLGHADEGLLEKLTENKTDLETQNLKRWLNRLFETASGRVDRNESFFKEVVNILQLAGSDENFRDNVFYRVLDGANVTCGDRIALSVLHLGVQKDLETLDTHHPEEVADFLVNGVMTLDLLEDYARDLVPTLPLTDPLEVYLGLPVYFKQEFKIPINTENMLILLVVV